MCGDQPRCDLGTSHRTLDHRSHRPTLYVRDRIILNDPTHYEIKTVQALAGLPVRHTHTPPLPFQDTIDSAPTRTSSSRFDASARSLLRALSSTLPTPTDGRSCVTTFPCGAGLRRHPRAQVHFVCCLTTCTSRRYAAKPPRVLRPTRLTSAPRPDPALRLSASPWAGGATRLLENTLRLPLVSGPCPLL